MTKRVKAGLSLEALDELGDGFAEMVARRLQATVRKALKTAGLGEVVVAAAQAMPSPNDFNSVIPTWMGAVDAELLPETVSTWVASSAEQAKELSARGLIDDAAPLTFNSESLAAQAYASGARNRLVGIGDELWGHIRDEIQLGIQNGESIPNITNRIKKTADMTTPRAQVIARTETIGASNAGSIATMRASGLVTKKEWMATRDPRTRASHLQADGQLVLLEETFSIGGFPLDHPGDPGGPAHEVINCRCTMTYEVVDEITDPVCTACGLVIVASAGMVCAACTPNVSPLKPGISQDQFQAMSPDSSWTEEKRQAILDALNGSDDGRVLAETLDRFQDGGSIARLRNDIEKYLLGEELNPTRANRARVLIESLRNVQDTILSNDTVLYRGMSVKGTEANLLKKYIVGDRLDLNLTSFSTDRNIARKFQTMTAGRGTTRVMVELIGNDRKIIPIQNMARDKRLFKEKEWVSGGKYEILEVKKSPSGGLILRIRQTGTL